MKQVDEDDLIFKQNRKNRRKAVDQGLCSHKKVWRTDDSKGKRRVRV